MAMPGPIWLPPGVGHVPVGPITPNYAPPQDPNDIPTLNSDGTLTPPGGDNPSVDTPLGNVPVDGPESTTDGISVGDALTWSTGNPLLDAVGGGLAGYAAAPPRQRAAYAAAGAVGAGFLGVLGIVAVVGTALLLGRRNQ